MELTPKQIVRELDRYIIGQEEAKRAVAVALRNRYRRAQLPDEVRQEIVPKNILMIGPTGVGKTEIARRLARLVDAPFVKVEATKFTEVGYVGRDVESIVRDLVEASIRICSMNGDMLPVWNCPSAGLSPSSSLVKYRKLDSVALCLSKFTNSSPFSSCCVASPTMYFCGTL